MSKKVLATFVLELLMVGVASVSQATTINANLTVDNGFELYISTDDCQLGTLICSDDSWYDHANCTIPLTPGVTNYLHIVGSDWGVIAGVLGDFKLSDDGFSFSNGTQSLLTNTTTDWQIYIDGFCGTAGTITSQGANGAQPWGTFSEIDPTAQWIWTNGGYDLNTSRYFSTVITPNNPPVTVKEVPLTGIITTRNWEYENDEAQFKLTGMQAVKDDAAVAITDGLDMTIAFGATCDNPIYQKTVSASELNTSNSNQLRYTEGNLDVVRCIYSTGQCVINIKPEELKSLTDGDGNILDDLCSGPMTVCLTVGNTTYTNSGTWTQYDSGSGSWTKCRKDIATETN
ncbi:hypothetical protein [Candidatus Electronema sp. PJ]|uniref:hypothetical protein n=1 Tax=Candidatus Electronema sp. PJ TaxID=3401572 RepID=UPI003AA93F3B